MATQALALLGSVQARQQWALVVSALGAARRSLAWQALHSVGGQERDYQARATASRRAAAAVEAASLAAGELADVLREELGGGDLPLISHRRFSCDR